MKLYKLTFTFILLLMISNSCQSQEGEKVSLNYSAQTRGYYLHIKLEGNALEISENSNTQKIDLTNQQISKINEVFSEIDFSKIKNNLSIENLAVDKAIKATCIINYKEKLYNFEFDHNNAPKDIKELINVLQEYI